MVLDFCYSYFQKEKLALAIVLVAVLIAYKIVVLPRWTKEFHTETLLFAEIQI